MVQPLPVALFANRALGRDIGHKVLLVADNVLQRNGQMTCAGMIDHKGQAQAGQPLKWLLDTPGGQLLMFVPESENFLLPLPLPLFASGQFGFEFAHLPLQRLLDAKPLVCLYVMLVRLQGEQASHLGLCPRQGLALGLPLPLEAGIQFLLLTQSIAQLPNLGLQDPGLALGSLLEPSQRLFMVAVQVVDMQALSFDQAGCLLALLFTPILAGLGTDSRPLASFRLQARRCPDTPSSSPSRPS